MGKTSEISLYLAIRPRLTKVGPNPGVTSFTWACIGKTLEISMYLAIILHVAFSSRPLPRVPKVLLWSQIWPRPRVTSFT